MPNFLADPILCTCGHPAYKHIFGCGVCSHKDGRGSYCDCAKYSLPTPRKPPVGAFEVTAFTSQARKPKRIEEHFR
jgi:hypothetical protein